MISLRDSTHIDRMELLSIEFPAHWRKLGEDAAITTDNAGRPAQVILSCGKV